MKLIYASVRSAYTLLPYSLRLRVHQNHFLKRIKSGGQRWLLGSHQYWYNPTYYKCVESDALRSRETMAESIVSDLRPRRLIDVGCGTGALLDAIRARGVETMGLEYSDAGIELCRQRQLKVNQFNILKDSAPKQCLGQDVAISFEVAEHLPESGADRFVDLLCSLAPTVVASAATPGQGGNEHLNEQPRSYWIDKFAARGFRFDEELSSNWSKLWHAKGVAWFYATNVMVFRK